MPGLAGAIRDGAASLGAHAAQALQVPTLLVDLFTYKPPEELRVNLEDVEESWGKESLESGISLFNSPPSNGAGIAGIGNETTPSSATSGNGHSDPPAPIAPGHALLASSASEPLPTKQDMNKLDPVTRDILQFQLKVFKKSGLSETGTYLPKSIHPKYCKNNPQTDLVASMAECKMAVCGAVAGLLQKMNMHASEIDILVTTCSIYCPTPSMASMVVNSFKMRSDIHTCHLGGMGCANGVVAVNLMRDLLKAHPNSNALLVCNETTTPALYRGKDKHRLVTNVLFRMGASAILLSNKPQWLRNGRAKYVLFKALRVHLGASDDAYRAIFYGPDDDGINGIYLGLNVVKEASKALTIAMTKVGRHILTTRQLLQAVMHYSLKYLGWPCGTFQPSFAEGVQHFLIHAGGAKVLDGIGENLQLNEWHLEPSRAVLHDYGNVSSSTTWYTLTFIEAVRGLRRGDTVLQIGVGSGIKCGVNIWKALRNVDDITHPAWEHRVVESRWRQVLARQRRSSVMQTLLLLSVLVLVMALVMQNFNLKMPF